MWQAWQPFRVLCLAKRATPSRLVQRLRQGSTLRPIQVRWGTIALVLGLGLPWGAPPIAPALGQTQGNSGAESAAEADETVFPLELRRSPGFWSEVQALGQNQVNLSYRINQATSGTDPNLVRAAAGQTLIHLRQVERFLDSQVSRPAALCLPLPPPAPALNSPFSEAEEQAYCDLYASIADLESLLQLLNYRLGTLATVAEVKPLPLVSGEWVTTTGGIPQFVRGSLREPAPALNAPAPTLPDPVARPFDRPAKSPLGDYYPPLDPAIAPLGSAQEVLQRLDRRLGNLEQALARSGRVAANPLGNGPFVYPQTVRTVLAVEPKTLTEADLQAQADFLSLPFTGLSLLRPAQFYQGQSVGVRNRLNPTVAEQYPFPALLDSPTRRPPQLAYPQPFSADPVPLPPPSARLQAARNLVATDSFQPRLKLQVSENQTLQLVPEDLDYGFLLPIGNFPLEALTLDYLLQAPHDLDDDSPLPPIPLDLSTLAFLFTYAPPSSLEALQADRNRFLTGKQQDRWGLSQVLPLETPLVVNQTYVLRSIQFQVPEALKAGRLLTDRDRRYRQLLLEMPSSDLILAVQPIAQHEDGSYTLRWRVLGQFPHPEVLDLGEYVE